MKPVLMLAAGAIVVAGLVGCSSNKSPSASSGPGSAGNAGAPSSPKVVVAGQPQNSQQGQAICTKEGGRDGYSVKIDEAAPNEVDVEVATDASAVWFVSIKGFNDMELHYLPGTTTGKASATKDGSNYKVTGQIGEAEEQGGNKTYPFEIDFSCS